MQLVIKHLSELKPSKYNPALRIEEGILKPLLSSIEEYGILTPLLISPTGQIIDGHRRFRCCQILGIDDIPCLIVSNDLLTPEEIYEEVGTTQRKLSNQEAIYIHMNGGKVSKSALEVIKKIEELLGREELKRLGEMYVSFRIYSWATKAAKYLGKPNDKKFTAKTLLWLVDKKQSYNLRRAMEDHVDPKVIRDAIRSNRSLTRLWGAM